jgi:hypothetical protein
MEAKNTGRHRAASTAEREAKAQRQADAKAKRSGQISKAPTKRAPPPEDPVEAEARRDARRKAMVFLKIAMKAEIEWLDDCWHQTLLTFNKLEQACSIEGAVQEFPLTPRHDGSDDEDAPPETTKADIRALQAECTANIIQLSVYLDNPHLEGEADSPTTRDAARAGIGAMSGLHVHRSCRYFMAIDFLQWLGGRGYDAKKGRNGPQLFAVHLLSVLLPSFCVKAEIGAQFQHKPAFEDEDDEAVKVASSLPLKSQPRRPESALEVRGETIDSMLTILKQTNKTEPKPTTNNNGNPRSRT